MNRMYLVSIPILLLTLSFVKSESKERTKASSSEIWETEIGKTTFRTNISLTPSYLVIGSNGDNYRDAYITDNRNGVHIINRKTGKRVRNFSHGSFGDLDVNGTLIYNNLIYFGNDNDEFICADFKGNIKFSLPVSGDVESEAVLIKINGKNALVFGTEAGELRAINPSTGETLWQHFHEDFNGWKMGDNRLVFKVKTHFSSTYIFLEKPIIEDLNLDGTKDLVYQIGAEFYSVNGKNGQILSRFSLNGDWDNHGDKRELFVGSSHNSFIFSKEQGKVRITIPKYNFRLNPGETYGGDGYGIHLVTHDINGEIIKTKKVNEKSETRTFKKIPNENLICNGGAIYHFDENTNFVKKVDFENLKLGNQDYFSYFISDQFLEVGQHKCIVFLYEYENTIVFYDIDNGQAIRKFELKGRSEFIPIVEDINKDGRMNLLFADDSNQLTCIDLGKVINILNK